MDCSRTLLGAAVGLAIGFVLPLYLINDVAVGLGYDENGVAMTIEDHQRFDVFFTEVLGPILCCVIAIAAHIGMYCCYKLVSPCCSRCCCRCCCWPPPKPSPYEVVIKIKKHEHVISVGNTQVETPSETPVVLRRHKHEDKHGDDSTKAAPADTLEQVALVSLFILLLMGLATHLVNKLAPDDDKHPMASADGRHEDGAGGHGGNDEHKEPPLTVVGFISAVFGFVALVAAALPFVATYWLYKYPENTRIAEFLAPIDLWLAPLDRAYQKLSACTSLKRLPKEADGSADVGDDQRSEAQPQPDDDAGESVLPQPIDVAQEEANP